MDTVKVIEVVETTLLRRGEGTSTDPFRCITQYWSKDGQLLCEHDPDLERQNREAKDNLKEISAIMLKDQNTIIRLGEAINWALGRNGFFAPRPKDKGAFWWRKELLKRACLAGSPEELHSVVKEE